VQEKVTKENTPQNIAPGAHPALRVRVSGRASLTAPPCADSEVGAIHRAAPAGVSDRCRRNVMGACKAKAARILRARLWRLICLLIFEFLFATAVS